MTRARRSQLIAIAYDHAIGWLQKDCDSNDMAEDLMTEDEEKFTREYVRVVIVERLKRLSKS